ncbi:MAG TPA: UbiD family decarboxylase [Burkholderiales bacterium]|nr:UbiD family decarboxylase [Burkholderiales bacterium]
MSAPRGNPLDLRRWLDEARRFGEVRDVRGADWNLELGAISEVNVRKSHPPALLFDEIKGYPCGFRVLTCSTASPARLSSILRLGVETSHHALVQQLRGKPKTWQQEAARYDPVEAETGPIFENVQDEGEVDLEIFPSPLWHEKDGGRYIGTGCCVVTRDFDSDWVNVGTYRVMLHDRNHVGLDMVPGKHGAIQYDKYMKAGKPFPVAIVLGCDPLGYLISGIEVPFGMCEYDYIGAILGEPVAVVKGPLTGLGFPAASEIVLEGRAHPGDERTEGPFGEFHGYYPGKAHSAPVVTVERVYYRNDPILLGSPPPSRPTIIPIRRR